MSDLGELRTWVEQQAFERVLLSTEDCACSPAHLALRGIALARLAQVEPAQRVLVQVQRASGLLDVDARVDLAGLQILLGHATDAMSALESVLNEHGDHALALVRLAIVYNLQGRLREAVALLERSLHMAPQRITAWVNLVRTQIHLGCRAQAREHLTSAFEVWPAVQADLGTDVAITLERDLVALQFDCWAHDGDWHVIEQWLDERRLAFSDETRFDSGETPSWADDWIFFLGLYVDALVSQGLHDDADGVLKGALEHLPQHLDLLGRRANLAHKRGHLQLSSRLWAKVIRMAKQQQVPAVRLLDYQLQRLAVQPPGAVSSKRGLADEASQLAASLSTADGLTERELQSLRWRAMCAMAHVESDEGQYTTAEQLYRDVLAQNAHHLHALRGIGNLALQLGRLDEAKAWFEQVKQIDPVAGHMDLISARQFPEDERVLAWLENLATASTLHGPTDESMLFKLGQAWEKRGDYDKAFALTRSANDSSRQTLSYSPEHHRQHCARIRHAFGRELYAHRKDCAYRGEEASLPVFVVGMPRSGTTLVEQILAGHSEIFGAGELGVCSALILGMNRWEQRVGSGRAYPDCVDDLTPQLSHVMAHRVLDELKTLRDESKPHARFVIDKLPHNFEHIGLIKFLFPEAKIISVRRDPRDIAISNYFTDFAAKHGGMGFAYDLEWIGQQLADHNLLMHHWHQVFPGEILEVQYEDVVEDTEGMARKMLDYIGVDWEPQVLAFNELDRPVKTASVWQVRQPIYKTSKAKWERYKDHLQPLIAGTNAKISWEPIEMLTLPEPGWLNQGVEQYKADDLDGAEYTLKKLLHHIPEYGAAKAVLALIYLRKGHATEGVALLEQALQRCPWNKRWRADLVKALTILGDADKAAAVRQRCWPEPRVRRNGEDVIGHEGTPDEPHGIQRKASLGGGADWTRLQTTAAFE